MNTCVLILGGYINGYSIIQELHKYVACDIILFDCVKRLASFSNKIKKHLIFENSAYDLYQQITLLHEQYDKIIIYPTSDLYLENLKKFRHRVERYCFIPFSKILTRQEQYSLCDKLGIEHPKITTLNTSSIVKDNLKTKIIEGNAPNIYAYVCYKNKEGIVLNEYVGQKLSQYPNNYGVFASVSNNVSSEILKLGRQLVMSFDCCGIIEPEFKYDETDNKYKLIEINFRPMMWNKLGNLTGVDLAVSQYSDALGGNAPFDTQNKGVNIHMIYMKHELINLMTRRGYIRIFLNNLFNSDKTYFTVFDIKDIKPFLFDILCFMPSLIYAKKKKESEKNGN